jgi:hypothetical protein
MPVPQYFTTVALAHALGISEITALARIAILNLDADNPPGNPRLWKYERLEELRAALVPTAKTSTQPA